ncbi:MAG TPA: hypothetical protein VF008_02300, partial [Niastella sp.]
MKRVTLLSLIATVLVFSACKGDSKKDETGDSATPTTQTPASGEEPKPAAANQPKEYKVKITPDSAILGKKKEALVKLVGATAMSLADPDGKDNGVELVFNLTVTNKSTIGDGSSVSVSYSHARLQLDNGTNITCDSGTDFLRAQPEATSKVESWTFKVPAGAKPTALNLFMDETR